MMNSLIFGVLLGFFSVLLHLGFSYLTQKIRSDKFMWMFSGGIIFRFLIVIPLFILLIVVTKNEPLIFTFSFILSYIIFSVTEIFWFSRRASHNARNRP